MWQRTQKAGMSENEAIEELVKRGMSASEVNQFKQRLIKVQSSNKSAFSSQNSIRDTSTFLRDSSWVLAVPQVKRLSPYFGFEFFSNPNISFEPNFIMAPPKNYLVGPGDELTVTVTGANETDFTTAISKEGNYVLPYAGVVNLNGLTLEQATQKIKQKLKIAYPLISAGKTQVMVTVDNVKSMQIHVIGEAEKPGTYTLSSIANVFNVLYASGGPSANGSLRMIELIRNNKVIAQIDFYEFLLKGTLSKSLQLEHQDIIRFPVYQKRVSVNGQIKRPAVYELLEKETLQDLITMAGGLGDTAYRDAVKLVQLSNKERVLRDVSATDFAYFIPRNADSIYIEKVPAIYNNRIILAGAVNRPGNYELTKDLSLVKLIQKANGILEKAYTNRAAIFRRNPMSYDQSIISFEVSDVLSGKASDILLAKDDSIHIYAKDQMEEKSTITVGGNVRNPGIFSFKKGISVEDAIFKKDRYLRSLGKYMMAQNLREVTPEAHEYALKDAFEATFQDKSAIAGWLQNAKKKKGWGPALDVAMPFVQTPINITRRTAEYSPFGLGTGAYDLYRMHKESDLVNKYAKQLDNPKLSKSERAKIETRLDESKENLKNHSQKFVKNIPQGITGTALMIFGFLLASGSLIPGVEISDDTPSSDKEESFLSEIEVS